MILLICVGMSLYFEYCFMPDRRLRARFEQVSSVEQMYFERFGRFASFEDLFAFNQTLQSYNIFGLGIVETYTFESMISSNSFRIRAYPRPCCFWRPKLAVDSDRVGTYVFDQRNIGG